MTRASGDTQYAGVHWTFDQSGSGSGHNTTQAWVTLQLGIYELQYTLQYIVINNLFW
jgi:hypothetical protein